MPVSPRENELAEAVELVKAHGSINKAAEASGIPRTTLQGRLKKAEASGPPRSEIEFPAFPDDDLSIDQIIQYQCSRFAKRKASYDSHTWFPVKIKDDRPIGLLFVGDPHIDDNGCHWPLLMRHIEACRTTDGMYAVNIGDTTNAWGGRLIKKYADQDTSLKTAQRLAEWFLLDSGMKWLVWLWGNHDSMAGGDGTALLAQMAKRYGTHKLVMHDWEARFSIDFPNGCSIRCFAAHDFAGNSMWNPNHGPVKAARFGKDIDILACGHKHNYAVSQWELPEQQTAPMMVRVRGYKFLDEFARRHGFMDQEDGCSILVVLNPNAANRSGRTTAFVDVEAGAEYLTWIRKRAA